MDPKWGGSRGDRRAGGGASCRHGLEPHDAAWDVLVEQGCHGSAYEAVAARAGTSRPMLYRRWPQCDDLLPPAAGRRRRPPS
ncbi:helix-turn-helix domain-containing protein [Nonomuraea sp. NPDC004354]